MASVYQFPDIGTPKVASATNCGDSYKLEIQDSTISTTSDANYKHTRPRTTRMLRTWTFVWNSVSESDYRKLQEFYMKVGTFQQFEWTNPMDGNNYAVRFTESLNWQEYYPYGWRGTLKFEEV